MGTNPKQNSSTGAGRQRPYQQDGMGGATFVCRNYTLTQDGNDTIAQWINYNPVTGDPLADGPLMDGVNDMTFPVKLASEGEIIAESSDFEVFENHTMSIRFENVVPTVGVETQLLSLATATNVRSIEGYYMPPLLLVYTIY